MTSDSVDYIGHLEGMLEEKTECFPLDSPYDIREILTSAFPDVINTFPRDTSIPSEAETFEFNYVIQDERNGNLYGLDISGKRDAPIEPGDVDFDVYEWDGDLEDLV